MQAMNVLTNDQIRRYAPSVFAEGAHESRSDRYSYIPTISIIEALRGEGFFPVSAAQSHTRVDSKRTFTKHMLRFQRPADAAKSRLTRAIGDVTAQLCLVNSHDGSSAYQLLSGLYRLVCLNGMIAKMGEGDEVRVTHSGKVKEKVLDASFTVIANAGKAIEHAHHWASIQLTRPEALAFGTAAAALRYDAASQPVSAEQILLQRRPEDGGNDLWTAFNRAQENLIRGGQRYRTEAGRRQSSKEVRSIDRNVGINRGLWVLGEEMARLKTAA